jgi:hypothetical protein
VPFFQRVLLTALLVGIGPVPAFAVAPPPVPPWQPGIEKLIQQLAHADYRQREEAERRLANENPRILPLLRRALGSTDPEIRRRCLRLFHRHETAVLFAPKKVTLKLAHKPIGVILEEISKQTGYKINHWGGAPGGEANYSCDFVETPFWDAMEQLCKQAHLVIQPSYGDNPLQVQHGAGYAPHAGRDGAFRYTPNNFQLYRHVEIGLVNPKGDAGMSRSENLHFTFSVHAEPRLPILTTGEVRLESAYDNEKNSLIVPRNAGNGEFMFNGRGIGFSRRYYGGGNKQSSIQVQVPLLRVSEKASTVSVIRGVVPLTILVEQQPLVVTERILEAKGRKITVADVQFHFEDIKKLPNNQYTVQMTITNNSKDNQGDYTWMNTLYQRIELQDDKGHKYQIYGSSWGGSGPNHVQMTLTYASGVFGAAPAAKIDPPTKFIYHNWVTRQHEVHFEFRNLPLP